VFRFFYTVLRFFKIQFSGFEVIFELNLNHLAMKRFAFILFLNSCLTISLLAQNPDKKQNLPKENSKVTKEYDEKGNLIKFDSLYTYSWSGGDTTLLKSFSPKDFPNMFGEDFGFFSDSTSKGNSFFDDFDQLFAQPFNGVRDSMLTKRFEQFHDFRNFDFPNDSTALNFKMPDNFFDENGKANKDSISSKSPHRSLGLHPKSMEEMMQMMQMHMQEMEEYQRKFFQKQLK
jgi:hypothetical protein